MTGYPRRPGNRVIPWIDGIPFHERLAAAFRAARVRIWAIVSFLQPDFRFPDGTPWWVLLAEQAARGVDVRVLFWRNVAFFKTDHVFLGGERERAMLRAWDARWAARWDDSGGDPSHCHHQKAYLVDALDDDPIAFVGGMVLSHATLARPGHHHGHEKHDAFVELRGPVVVDAERNFVQRWNLARQVADAPAWPSAERANDLPWPERVPPACGEVEIALARTLRAGMYPGVPAETGVLDQYRAAFAGARRTIYMENQHPGHHELLDLLAQALERGVQVVLIVPGEPMAAIQRVAAEVDALAREGRAPEHRYGPTFQALAALGEHEGFTLAALARPGREIYTHAKLAIVDGEWLTIGSANFVDLSLDADHTELNATAWGSASALPLLRTLVGEHTDADSDALEGLDDLALLERIATLARASRASLRAGGPVLGGCYALDPGCYGRERSLAQLLESATP